MCSSLALPSNLSNLSSEREREREREFIRNDTPYTHSAAPTPSSPGGRIGSGGEGGRGGGEGSVGRRGGGGGGVDGGLVAGTAHTGGTVLSDEMAAMAAAGKVLKSWPYSDLI